MINMEKKDWTSSRADAMRAGTTTDMTLVSNQWDVTTLECFYNCLYRNCFMRIL